MGGFAQPKVDSTSRPYIWSKLSRCWFSVPILPTRKCITGSRAQAMLSRRQYLACWMTSAGSRSTSNCSTKVASSKVALVAVSTLILDNRHCPHPSTTRALDLDREHAHREAERRQLIKIRQFLGVDIFLPAPQVMA